VIQRETVPNAFTSQTWTYGEGHGPALLLAIYTEHVRDILAGSGAYLLLECTNRDGQLFGSIVPINSSINNGARTRCTIGFSGVSFPQGLDTGLGDSWWTSSLMETPIYGGERFTFSLINGIPSAADVWENTLVSWVPITETQAKKQPAPRTPRDELAYGCKLYKR
jgi:hypothetical protein